MNKEIELNSSIENKYTVTEKFDFEPRSSIENKDTVTEEFDFELKSREGDEVKAHKSVLKKKSKYFRNLFSENHEDNTIKFENVSGNVLRKTINYMYEEKCDFKNVYDIIDCYIFADTIRFKEFENYIIDKIKSFKTEDEIIEITERLEKIIYIDGVSNITNYLKHKIRDIESDIKLTLTLADSGNYLMKIKTKSEYDSILKSYLDTFNDDKEGLYKLSSKKKLYIIPVKKINVDYFSGYTLVLATKEMLISEYGFEETIYFDDEFEKIGTMQKKEVMTLIFDESIINKTIERIEEKKHKENSSIDELFNKYC
jgi:hypothetical protein